MAMVRIVSGSFSFETEIFAATLKPGAYRLETLLYGWNQPLSDSQLAELARLGSPFLIGENAASLPVDFE